MNKLVALIFSAFVFAGIYTFSVPAIDGTSISLGNFQGKKILMVNTASTSMYTPQYAQLEQLFQKYKDSLVVIAFPSNSFNHEPSNNAAIKNFIATNYNAHFLIAAKADVTGQNQSPFYKWLTHFTQNGIADRQIKNDFDKFLFDGQGNLIGHFHPAVNPMDAVIQDAIEGR